MPKKSLCLSRELELPLDAVTQTFAVLAMRGVGKTHTASVLAEELSEAGLPYVVLDPTGAWWGLRASADGKGDGYPVTILGGDHGDVPLEEGGGKLIADLVAEKAPSLILDLSLLSKAAMRRFVADFAERLYERNRTPLQLIIDEADAFAPQKPRPDETRMLGAIDEIVRRGRIRGLGCTLVTQRSAVLNKDVLTQSEMLVVLRTAHPRDRAPVLEWMKVHATPEQLGAVEGYGYDMRALAACDACVLVQPCGRSAHLELGYAAGAGKLTLVLLRDGTEPELMYRMCSHLCLSVSEVVSRLEGATAVRHG